MRPKWWLPKIKPFVGVDVWYCQYCEDITEVETNDILSTCSSDQYRYYGNSKPAIWFARCWECKSKHFQPYEFSCPECGFWCDDEEYIIEYSEPVFNMWKSMEFGGQPMDWEETAKCPKCQTIYWYINSNC